MSGLNFRFCHLFKINIYLIFRELGKLSQNLSSTAVVIGALRVNALIMLLNELFEKSQQSTNNHEKLSVQIMTRNMQNFLFVTPIRILHKS